MIKLIFFQNLPNVEFDAPNILQALRGPNPPITRAVKMDTCKRLKVINSKNKESYFTVGRDIILPKSVHTINTIFVSRILLAIFP